MTLVQMSLGLADNELDKYSLNSLSQKSSPTNSSLLTCDSRPNSANHNIIIHNNNNNNNIDNMNDNNNDDDDNINGNIHRNSNNISINTDNNNHTSMIMVNNMNESCLIEEAVHQLSNSLDEEDEDEEEDEEEHDSHYNSNHQHHHHHHHHHHLHQQQQLNRQMADAASNVLYSDRMPAHLAGSRRDGQPLHHLNNGDNYHHEHRQRQNHHQHRRERISLTMEVDRSKVAAAALTLPIGSRQMINGHHSPGSLASSTASPTSPSSPLVNQPIERVRRPSRCEHRKSLSDLGYGKVESYARLQRLGKGTYATVYLGRSRLSNDLVALKEILKEHNEGAPCTAIREISLLRLLRHNNIVTLHDICHTPKKLTLVFEYVGPDLYAYMRENNNLLSINNIRLLLYQLLRGISFCHSRQVLHRDLKPQNLLINTRGELKICDFGLARAKSIPTKSYSNEVVTLWYRPPDVLLGNTDYDHSIDMWGIGCIFYEMVSGRTFFPGSSERQQLYLIFSNLGSPNRYNWPEILLNPEYQQYKFPNFRPEKLHSRLPRLDPDGINLLIKFLRFRPSERISAEEAKLDPFFACLPEKVHHLCPRESIFDVPGVYMTVNPGQRLNNNSNM